MEPIKDSRGGYRHRLHRKVKKHRRSASQTEVQPESPQDESAELDPPRFHFFVSLPGEIRNNIYEIVLTPQSDSLVHRTGRLPDNQPMNTVPDWVRVGGSTETELPPPPDRRLSTRGEFNQLKYVSKQMRRETLGLELKYARNIRFRAHPHPTRVGLAIDLFESTYHSLPNIVATDWLRNIRKVYFTPTTPPFIPSDPSVVVSTFTYAEIRPLMNFARDHPHVLIYVGRLEGLDFTLGETDVLKVCNIYEALRGLPLAMFNPFRVDSPAVFEELVQAERVFVWDTQHLNDDIPEKVLPINFRFMLPLEKFDEVTFRRYFTHCPVATSVIEAFLDSGGVDGWLATIKKLYEEGI